MAPLDFYGDFLSRCGPLGHLETFSQARGLLRNLSFRD